jgi:hypothetical protein
VSGATASTAASATNNPITALRIFPPVLAGTSCHLEWSLVYTGAKAARLHRRCVSE